MLLLLLIFSGKESDWERGGRIRVLTFDAISRLIYEEMRPLLLHRLRLEADLMLLFLSVYEIKEGRSLRI